MEPRKMNASAGRFFRFGLVLFGLVTLGWILTGSAAKPVGPGVPTDWSHRHVIFSKPSTPEQIARVANDPRYWQQVDRMNMFRDLPADAAVQEKLADSVFRFGKPAKKGDWSQDLGSNGSVGAGNYPAKYSFQITSASCGSAATPDYVVFATGLSSSSSQASVVAYDNLYSGCTGTVPSVYWAYDTDGQVLTSPVISGDGTQVAFVETNGGYGILVLLKWAASSSETVISPMTLTPVSHTAYRACTAPCMTKVYLKDSSGTVTDDQTSSAFPDYTNDTIWVGGASGWLHKITGVFRGHPKEETTGGFPVQVNPSDVTSLSSPVYDYASGTVFVGDYGGNFYSVSASSGAVTQAAQVDFGVGVVAGPVVDSTSEQVYVFASSDGGTDCLGGPCSGVFQFPTAFAAGASGTEAEVGASSGTVPLFDGDFDNAYLTSGDATGNLYVCGQAGVAPNMYQIQITAGSMDTVVTGPALSSAGIECSPVTDISNPNASGGTTEWFFAGVQDSGLGNSCAASGCIMNFTDTPWTPSTFYNVGQEVLDDKYFQIQIVTGMGMSGVVKPPWSNVPGGTTHDGPVTWLNQGPLQAGYNTWQPGITYRIDDGTLSEIVDSNNNIELVTKGGTSGGSTPSWKTSVNATTDDGTVHWLNVGAVGTQSQAAAGGTSGIIIDNIVSSGTLTGGSQIYYSTQQNQVCGTSGTGGCAVQASQSALQ
jgi:hypothetical protein